MAKKKLKKVKKAIESKPTKVRKVSKKKSKKSKVKKKPVKEIKPKVNRNTGYRQYLHELSVYNKEHGIKVKGRGGFLHKAGTVWTDLKDKPNVIENLDVIIPQYFEEGLESIVGNEFKDKYGFTTEEFEKFIEVNAYTDFPWWEGHGELDKLMKTSYWHPDFILRMSDKDGEFVDCYSYNEFERKIYVIIKQDYRANRTESGLPTFIFESISVNEENQVIVNYNINGWDFSHVKETQDEIEAVQKEYADRKGKQKAAKGKGADSEIELQKFKIEQEIQSRERVQIETYKLRMAEYKELLKEKIITLKEYNEALNDLSKLQRD